MSDKFKKFDSRCFNTKPRMEKSLHGNHLSSPIYQRCGMKRPAIELQRRKWRQMRMGIRVQTEDYRDSEAYRESLAIAQRLAYKISSANRVFHLTFGLIVGLLFYTYDGFCYSQSNSFFTSVFQTIPESQPKPDTTSTCMPVDSHNAQVPELSINALQQAISVSQARQPVNIAESAYNLDFKVRELTKGTGNNISNVRVDIDNGSYIGFTDANGVAHIPQIPAGSHTINMSKDGYLEFTQANYTLNGNKTFNASIPKKTQVGPWGTTTLNADWYKATFIDAQDAGAAGQDPYRWAQIIPINNRIVNATKADSALVLQAISALESNTGYDLINVGNYPEESSYTINMNANTDFSAVGTDENYIIFAGASQITRTDQTKRIIHEIVQQFDMWPTTLYPSVMDPTIQTQTNPQPYDYMHIALTISEHKAKVERGEQDMFLGNMYNYSALIAPVKTAITSPANNATNLDKLVRLTWNNVIDANKYNVDIATDAGFTNMVKDFNAQRIDTTITLSENTKYYMRVRAENTTGNATWSDVITFTTKSGIITPGNTSITTPVNNATNVVTPVTYTWNTSSNATQYNLEVSLDNTFQTLVQDVIITTPATTLTLNGNRTYFNRVRGENSGANGAWSTIISYTTKNTAPSAATNLNPNSSIDATTSNNFTWTKGSDADLDALTQTAIIATTGWDTTIYNANSPIIIPANKLKGHTNYTWKVITSDGTIETTSNIVNFSTINHAPSAFEFTKPVNNERIEYTNHNLEIGTTVSTDKDDDPLTKIIRLVGGGLDTLLYTDATTQTIYLESNKLKLNTEYTLTGELTDDIATTQATNSITFKTPTGVGLTDLLATGVVAVFPNPSQGKISVKTNFDTPQNMQITVYDQVGRQVAGVSVKVVLKTTIPVDLSASAPGIYTFRITTQKGTVWHKVVIAR